MLLHSFVSSKYFDLANAGVIGLNVIMMALEYYLMPWVSSVAVLCIKLSTFRNLQGGQKNEATFYCANFQNTQINCSRRKTSLNKTISKTASLSIYIIK